MRQKLQIYLRAISLSGFGNIEEKRTGPGRSEDERRPKRKDIERTSGEEEVSYNFSLAKHVYCHFNLHQDLALIISPVRGLREEIFPWFRPKCLMYMLT